MKVDQDVGSDVTLSASATGTSFILPSGGIKIVTISFSGLPNHVTKGHFRIQYQLQLSNGIENRNYNFYDIAEDVYIVNATPTGLQSVPWTDLLDYTCGWAYGESTVAGVCSKITEEFTNSGEFKYRPDVSNTFWKGDHAVEESEYDLKRLLDQFYDNNNTAMDCYDIAGLQLLMFSGQGISGGIRFISHEDYVWNNPEYRQMGTNEIYIIGDTTGYGRTTFHYHTYFYTSGNVYDSSIKFLVDLAGASYEKPAMGWAESDYRQKTNPTPEPHYFGLLRREWKNGEGTTPPGIVPLDIFNRSLDGLR